MSATRLLRIRPDLETVLRARQTDRQIPEEEVQIELRAFDILYLARNKYDQMETAALDKTLELARQADTGTSYEAALKSHILSSILTLGHRPAYIIGLNYDPLVHKEHTFDGVKDWDCVEKSLHDPTAEENILSLAYEDNAMLVRRNGVIDQVKTLLVNVNPAAIEGKLGFVHDVHARHKSTIGASLHMPGTVFYTLGEKGVVRRFEAGKITFSTQEGEG